MFGLSFWEIAVILVVALLALGPERLPKLLKTIGKGMREVRKASNELKSAIEEPLQELREPLEEVRDGIYQGVAYAEREIEAEAQRIEAAGESLLGLHDDDDDDDDDDDVDDHLAAHDDAAADAHDDAHAALTELDAADQARYLAEHDEIADSDADGDAPAQLASAVDHEDAATRLDVEDAATRLDAAGPEVGPPDVDSVVPDLDAGSPSSKA